MPLFFFQITHHTDAFAPTELELPDPDAAWEQAVVTAGEVLRDLGGRFRPGTEWRMDVMDASHTRIFALRIIAEAYS